MKNKFFIALGLCLSGCSTLNESLQLGGLTGGVTGLATIYTAQAMTGESPKDSDILLNTGIGTAIGLISSYLIHKNIETKRADFKESTQMHFGDLPPSPFIYNSGRR